MVWYARLRYTSSKAQETHRRTSFQGTQGGVDTHRLDFLQALEEFQINVPTWKFPSPVVNMG